MRRPAGRLRTSLLRCDDLTHAWRRHEAIDLNEALSKLSHAQGLGIRSVPVRRLWQGALVRAHESGLAGYDTLFVELAHREEAPLATFDRRLLSSFPELAARPARLDPP